VPDPSFIPNVDACAVAVDDSHIYWADYGGASGGSIGRANLDGTGVDEDFIETAGGTCGVAVDGLSITQPPGPTPPAPPPSCPYGNPDCASICTNPTTLLVTCADFTASAGFCRAGDAWALIGNIPPQCAHPVTPPTVCRNESGRGVVCYGTTQGRRPGVGSCEIFGTTLPECNVPRREVPLGCQGIAQGVAPAVCGPLGSATLCPPPGGFTIGGCNFRFNVSPSSLPTATGAAAGAAQRRRRGAKLAVTIGCPAALADPKSKRCRGTIAVAGLRTSLLNTLAKQANYSASIYRFLIPDLAGFAEPFERSASAIAKQALGGRKLPKAVKPAAVIAALGRSDPQTTSFALSLQRAVAEYRRIAGRGNSRRSKRATATQSARRTATLKRFRLRSGRRRARIRVGLSTASVRRLRRGAAKRGPVPIRVIVSYKAEPRPVVRFADLALRVTRNN
jgi:hypothetical protein